MNFEVVDVARGYIRLTSGHRVVSVQGEGLLASSPSQPSYVVYTNSLHTWQVPPPVALTGTEKQHVISAIRKYFESSGSVVMFEE